MQELVKYWREEFSWQKQQTWLNTHFNNFKLVVDGLNLHFVHHRSQHADAKPLLLIHGWPGSFIGAPVSCSLSHTMWRRCLFLRCCADCAAHVASCMLSLSVKQPGAQHIRHTG